MSASTSTTAAGTKKAEKEAAARHRVHLLPEAGRGGRVMSRRLLRALCRTIGHDLRAVGLHSPRRWFCVRCGVPR